MAAPHGIVCPNRRVLDGSVHWIERNSMLASLSIFGKNTSTLGNDVRFIHSHTPYSKFLYVSCSILIPIIAEERNGLRQKILIAVRRRTWKPYSWWSPPNSFIIFKKILTSLTWVSVQVKRYFTTRRPRDNKLVENTRSDGFLALEVGRLWKRLEKFVDIEAANREQQLHNIPKIRQS